MSMNARAVPIFSVAFGVIPGKPCRCERQYAVSYPLHRQTLAARQRGEGVKALPSSPYKRAIWFLLALPTVAWLGAKGSMASVKRCRPANIELRVMGPRVS